MAAALPDHGGRMLRAANDAVRLAQDSAKPLQNIAGSSTARQIGYAAKKGVTFRGASQTQDLIKKNEVAGNQITGLEASA